MEPTTTARAYIPERSLEELEGALLPIASPVVPTAPPESQIYPCDPPEAATLPSIKPSRSEEGVIIKNASLIGKLKAEEEKDLIERANRNVYAQNYQVNASIHKANQKARLEKSGAAVARVEEKEYVVKREKKEVQEKPSQPTDGYKVVGYDIPEYSVSEYKTGDYQVSEYKSVYDS